MRSVTVDQVMKNWRPCEEYPRERIEKLFGRRRTINALQVAAWRIPIWDRLFALGHLLNRSQRKEALDRVPGVDGPDASTAWAFWDAWNGWDLCGDHQVGNGMLLLRAALAVVREAEQERSHA